MLPCHYICSGEELIFVLLAAIRVRISELWYLGCLDNSSAWRRRPAKGNIPLASKLVVSPAVAVVAGSLITWLTVLQIYHTAKRSQRYIPKRWVVHEGWIVAGPDVVVFHGQILIGLSELPAAALHFPQLTVAETFPAPSPAQQHLFINKRGSMESCFQYSSAGASFKVSQSRRCYPSQTPALKMIPFFQIEQSKS